MSKSVKSSGPVNHLKKQSSVQSDDESCKVPDIYLNAGNNLNHSKKPNELTAIDRVSTHVNNDGIYAEEKTLVQKIGSGKSGVYPYNINSNTSDKIAENLSETKSNPKVNETLENQDFIQSHKKEKGN